MKEYKDLNDYELIYMVSENNEEASNLIYEKYKPIIINFAHQYYKIGKRYGLELEDLIQEGYYGLYNALINFKEDKNCLFYTYAIMSIKSKMQNLCKVNDTNGNKMLNNSISLYTKIDCYDETIIMDFIADKNSLDPLKETENMELLGIIKDNVYGKSMIRSSILELKLNGFNNKAISKLLDINTNRICKELSKIKDNLKLSLKSN